jgi:hypothetical protein
MSISRCEGSYEDTGTIVQLELIDLHCSNEIRSKIQVGESLNFS